METNKLQRQDIIHMTYARLFISVLLAGLIAGPALAKEEVGEVTKYEGTVKYYADKSVKGINITEPGLKVHTNDSLRTKKRSSAFLSLVDGSRIIVTERSHVKFKGIAKVGAESGKVLFDIKKQGGLKGFQILTRTAVIGVKGTRFLVDRSEGKVNVFMKEGVVSVESLKGMFKKYKQQQQDEFDSFKNQMEGGFKDFKDKLNKEFEEFKSFDVKAGQAISIDGSEVSDLKITPEIEQMFDMFNQF